MAKDSIICIRFELDDVPARDESQPGGFFETSVSTHKDLVGYAFLDEHLKKDPSLGRLFPGIEPLDNGFFRLELGVALPDWIPNLGEAREYQMDVGREGSSKTISFSNAMARIRFQKEGENMHALLPRAALSELGRGELEFIPADVPVEFLRTFASSTYEISGASAEDALETHASNCIDDLIERLNLVLKALSAVERPPGYPNSLVYTRASPSNFYFAIGGRNQEWGHGWFSAHVGSTSFRPPPLDGEAAEKLRGLASGSISPDETEALIYAAQGYAEAGVLEYALLLAVIAAEVETNRYVSGRMRQEGVSKTKWTEYNRDLTYSIQLNLVLASVAPQNAKPTKALIGQMNKARRLRNEYMHKGKLDLDHAEMSELVRKTQEYVTYLPSISPTLDPTNDKVGG